MKHIATLVGVIALTITGSLLQESRAETPRVAPRAVPRPAAAATSAAPAPNSQQPTAIPNEKVAVEQYQQQYWKGRERERSVVQYKLYPRNGRFQLGLEYGFGSGDPFLSIRALSGYLGYNFSEYWALNLLYTKWTSNYSSAYTAFVAAAGVGTNSNPLKSFMGGEVAWNLLYGKLSLLGASIIHFDLIASLGGGLMNTDNGNGMSGLIGLGQQFYLNRTVSLKLDYRAFMFREKLIEKVGPPSTSIPVGTEISTGWSWVHSVTAGVVFMF